LVENCILGKRDAQYLLYKKYSKSMYNICLRMLNDQSEAEDVLQNAFVDVFTKIKMFRYESTLGAWIKRIVINNCINHIRKLKVDIVSVDNIQDREDEVSSEDTEYNLDVVIRAIEMLPDGYRMIFNLYTLEGYDHGEIAEILNISESTSKSQYSRAKTKLHDILKSSGDIHSIYKS